MEIIYKTKKLEKQCTIASETQKVYGKEMADKIHQRLDEIRAATKCRNANTVSYRSMSYTA